MSFHSSMRRVAAGVALFALLAILAAPAALAQRAADLATIRSTAPPPPAPDPAASFTIQLGPSPIWVAGDAYEVSTGGALADIDGDGLLDFVVSNGNDMAEQPQTVYRNLGAMFETLPSWTSTDRQFSGHCAAGDVSGDGRPELAVANYGSFAPQRAILYRNLGAALEPAASWQTADLNNSFSCAFGDVDLDADLDLAVANGEAYSGSPQRNDLYLNQGGALATSPAWLSNEIESSYDVAWGDVDRDGDLDLAVISALAPVRLYDNQGGVLGASSIWASSIAENGNSLAFGDVNGDGFLDLAVATNRQLGGTGRFRLFLNQGGVLATSPSWTSNVGNVYGSAVAFADLDGDGDEDLVAGAWWGQVVVFENLGGTLTTGAAWISSTTSVVEAIVPGDVDGDGIYARTDVLPANGQRRLFYAERRPIQRLLAVRADGVPLAPSQYAIDRDSGWISVAIPPGSSLTVEYLASNDLDLAVTNWDSNIGNYVFENRRPVTAVAGAGAPAASGLRVFPLPAAAGEWVTVAGGAGELRVIAASGRVLERLAPGAGGAARFRPVAPGVVWIQAASGGGPAVKVVVLP